MIARQVIVCQHDHQNAQPFGDVNVSDAFVHGDILACDQSLWQKSKETNPGRRWSLFPCSVLQGLLLLCRLNRGSFLRHLRHSYRWCLLCYFSILGLGVLLDLLELFFLLFLALLLQFLLTFFVLIVYFSQFGILSCC